MLQSAAFAAPLALVNARLIDPESGSETRGGVFMEDGVIRDVGAKVTKAGVGSRTRVIDCAGDCVSPGLIEMSDCSGPRGRRASGPPVSRSWVPAGLGRSWFQRPPTSGSAR